MVAVVEVFKKEKAAKIGYVQRVDIYFNFIGKINYMASIISKVI